MVTEGRVVERSEVRFPWHLLAVWGACRPADSEGKTTGKA